MDNDLAARKQITRLLVSKTVVLGRWGVKSRNEGQFGLSAELITKGKLATVKRFESLKGG